MRVEQFLAVSAVALLAVACGPKTSNEEDAGTQTPAADISVEENTVDETAPSDDGRTDERALLEKQAAENLAAATKFMTENKGRDGVTVTDSGLQYMVIEEGPDDGDSPVSTDTVVFEYTATKSDGIEFDSSRLRGGAATVPVGALNNELPGLTEGLQLMSVGDTYRFFLPPDLALGDAGSADGQIQPNEALIYEINLVKIQNSEKSMQAALDFLEANAKKDGIKTTESGLQYEILQEGEEGGKSPAATDVVKVHYAGTLINGTEFDSSIARGEPTEFPLNRVIAGWTEGVQLMSVGDKYRFFVPPQLAYGESGTPGGPIGPNEALIFEVELLEVK